MRQLQSRLSHWQAVGQTPQLWPSFRRLYQRAGQFPTMVFMAWDPPTSSPVSPPTGNTSGHVTVWAVAAPGACGEAASTRGAQHGLTAAPCPLGGGGVTKREKTERGGAATGGVCVCVGGGGGG